jgi:large subunit ribosomal protein L10
MENPRPEKVAVVDEIKARFEEADAVLLTEYRGLNVSQISELRRALRAAGGEYKVYKNTLVGFAAEAIGLELGDLLTGPTALAFVTSGGDTKGDPVTVAKALRDFARGNPNLVVKGGVLGDSLLSADEAKALADVAPREELLARLAGGLAAPMVQFAGLLQALPRNFAYGLKALIDQGGAPGAPTAEAPAEAAESTAEAPAEAAASDAEAPAEETTTDTTAEAPAEAAESTAEAPAEAAESTAEAPAEAAESPAEATEAEATDTAEATEAEADAPDTTAEAAEAEADDSPEEN